MGRAVRLGTALTLFIIFIGMAGLSINGAIQEQPKLKWAYMGGALLAFVSGFSVTMAGIGYIHRCFQIEIEAKEKRVGRSLLESEIQQMGLRFREKRKQGGTDIPFPLQRLVTRLLLLLPAVILVSFAVLIMAFFGGFSLAFFIEEYRKRTMLYF
jgi:hypothetical protein